VSERRGKYKMKTKVMVAITIAGMAISQAANAITIGADRLLGTVMPGVPANPGNEMVMVNGLLDGWGSVQGYKDGAPSGTVMGDNPADPQGESYKLTFSPTTFIPAPGSAPLATTLGLNVSTGNTTINLGSTSYDWVLAKWGPDAAAYYIGGLSGQITLTIAGTGWRTQGHGLSGYSLFNGHTVPDGGLTAGLLGMAVAAMGFARKMI
jgi:hypothetical protein